MNDHLIPIIRKITGAESVYRIGLIQNLWSDYGQILRYGLTGHEKPSVVVKRVLLKEPKGHPRGWKSDHGHLRKLRSYQVETHWYKHYAHFCGDGCRIPRFIGSELLGDEVVMVLEDLDAAGYPVRRASLERSGLEACLKWLACFHATFLDKRPEGLWETGTYWHLETRLEELAVLDDEPLKRSASYIDKRLKEIPYQTLVHGDAKLANFCFSADGRKVAAVDFQYVGAGCGMKDLAYFVGSCLDEEESEAMENELLDVYFAQLCKYVRSLRPQMNVNDLELSWRGAYHLAWADFHRFLKGWSPGHWKINSYSERIVREVIDGSKAS